MPIDRSGDPWPGATYNGFAGAGPAAPPPPPGSPRVRPEKARRTPSRAVLIGGVGAALALGLVFGFVARPELAGSNRTPMSPPTPTAADLASPNVAAGVPIAVAEAPPPAPDPEPVGRLETLPREMAAATTPAAPITMAPPPAPIASVPAAPPAPAPAPRAVITPAPSTAPTPTIAAPAPEPRLQASFDCGRAREGAEQIVCSDSRLAAADRRMADAYRRALDSGVPRADLSQEQRDWVQIREEAAQHSRRALGSVYEQRIRELNEIADGGYAPD